MDRPFWSVMIPTFNCAQTLKRTIESVLARESPHRAMQIEVVDDCSSRDRPEEVANAYRERSVTFYRQPSNIGASANFNSCIARAKGDWVHILHGDDYVHPDFYSALERGISLNESVRVAFTSFTAVNDSGQTVWSANDMPKTRGIVDYSWRDVIAEHSRIMAPAIVVQRSAFGELGGFNSSLVHTADWDMWKRLIWKFDSWFEPQVLAFYTLHPASDTSQLMRSGENLRDSLRAIKIGEKYFPIDRRKKLARAARESHAALGLISSRKYFAGKDYSGAFAQLRASVELAPGFVLGRLLSRLASILQPNAQGNA